MSWEIDARELLQLPSLVAALYRGRMPDPRLEGTIDGLPVDPEQPHEPMADGCPAGWIRTAYMDSVVPYLRRRTEGGGRVQNPRFDRADEHVQAAVLYLEHEDERWHIHREGVRAEAAARERRRRKQRGPR